MTTRTKTPPDETTEGGELADVSGTCGGSGSVLIDHAAIREFAEQQPAAEQAEAVLRVRLIPEAFDTVPVITGKFQVMPPPTLDEYRALVESIADNGVQVPVLVCENGDVIDGHYRRYIADKLGIDCPTRTFTGTDHQKIDLAYKLNISRRHLTQKVRRELLERSIKERPELSDRQHSERTGTSPTTVGTVRRELEETGEVSKLDTHKGADGSQQPASKPKSRSETPPKPRAPKGTAAKAERISATVIGVNTMARELAQEAKKLAKMTLTDNQAAILDANAKELRQVADQLELLAVNAKFANAPVISG